MGALSMPSLSILSCTHHSKLPLFGADPAAARGINFATQRYPIGRHGRKPMVAYPREISYRDAELLLKQKDLQDVTRQERRK